LTGTSLPLCSRWRRMARSGTMPDPPATRSRGSAVGRLPGEVAAHRAAYFQLVADAHVLGQVRGDLAVIEPFDRDGHRVVGGPAIE
jgi:hypothetical protein